MPGDAKEDAVSTYALTESRAQMDSSDASWLSSRAARKGHVTAVTTFLIRRIASLALIVIGSILLANTVVHAGPILDPANDFRTFDPSNPSSYAGPNNPGLDVLSANVILDLSQQTLTITSTMAGPISGLINPTTGALLGSFSWGINHGYGNNNFAAIGLPNVLFDAVLTLNPNDTGTYRGSATPAGAVTASGNTLTAVLPISFLAPPPPPANAQGPLLPVTEWTYNLWPRSSIRTDGSPLGFGNAQIADFAPDTDDFAATTVPEPSGAALFAAGLLGTRLLRLRRRLQARR